MPQNAMSTHDLTGRRVIGGSSNTRRIGKVKYFLFHPREKRCICFAVKRPDLLWMFRRKDKFVLINNCELVDNEIKIGKEALMSGPAVAKELEIDWNACILWTGLPLVTDDGATIGCVGDVSFDASTGEILSIQADTGATANTLLGTRCIPASLIKGFRSNIGSSTSSLGESAGETSRREDLGAILVSNEAFEIETEGGLAERAGKTTAIAADKAEKAAATAKAKVKETAAVASKKTGISAEKTEEVVTRGAYATGKQISRAKGMFSEFKKEYDRALRDEEE